MWRVESEFFRVDKAHEGTGALSTACGAIKPTGFQGDTNSMLTYRQVAEYMLVSDWVKMGKTIG